MSAELRNIEPWVDTTEAARFIGKPESWIYANARRAHMPFVKVGQHYRWKLSALDAWLEGQVSP